MNHHPLNIAHRGASAMEPENTIRAFQRAYDDGADGIELDVFLTSDKKIVVTHDQDTARLTGQKFNVRKTSLKTLRTLNYGKGSVIPTLSEVFEEFLPKFSVINVEIKSTGFKTDGIEAKVTHWIQKMNAVSQILVSSFNPLNLARCKNILPQLRIGYLIEPKIKLTKFHMRNIKWLQPDTLNLHHSLYEHKSTRILFDLGLPIWIWGVTTEKQFREWIERGAQAIINDTPNQLTRLLK